MKQYGHRFQGKFENLLNLTSSSNLAKVCPNFSPLLQATVRDMNDMPKKREWVLKQSDKNGGLALIPFAAYNQAGFLKRSQMQTKMRS